MSKLTDHLRSYNRSSGYARWMRRAADVIDNQEKQIEHLLWAIKILVFIIVMLLWYLVLSTRVEAQILLEIDSQAITLCDKINYNPFSLRMNCIGSDTIFKSSFE